MNPSTQRCTSRIERSSDAVGTHGGTAYPASASRRRGAGIAVAVLATLGLGAFAPSTARAQSIVWGFRTAGVPSARAYGAMAYDSARGVSVYFGGIAASGAGLAETWEWNGTGAGAWTQRVVSGPSVRSYPAMAYDSARGVTVLFGGQDPQTGFLLADIWEWNGSVWTQRASSPGFISQHAMVYDSARGVIVLFGGFTGGYIDQTWEWNGTVWTQRVVSGPSPRGLHAMAYDSARGVTVLFGGHTGTGSAETWEWNGTVWTRRLVSGPSGRERHTMIYDASRGVTVLYGGSDYFGNNPVSDYWEWNGTVWTQAPFSGPPARSGHAMAYDSARRVAVVFGGRISAGVLNDETWETCTTASVASQPATQAVCPSGTALFSVTAGGSSPFTFRWQWQPAGTATAWVNLVAGDNAEVGGTPVVNVANVTTTMLMVHPLPGYTIFPPRSFRCVVTNSCNSVPSNPATLNICVADTDDGSGTGVCDGGVTIDDLLFYLNIFEQGVTRADVDDGSSTGTPDGGVTIDDLLYYLQRFEAGC